MLRTARSWSVPPMQLHANIPGWTYQSRMLAMALTALEDDTGPEGFPLAEELDPDSEGWYEAEVLTNQAVAARHRHAKDYKPQPGEFVVIRDTRLPDLASPRVAADEESDQETEPDRDGQ